MTQASSRALVVFLKDPKSPETKTRLATGIGREKAQRIYQALIDYTLQTAISLEVPTYLYFAGEVPENAIGELPEHFHFRVQTGQDLGARMANAINETLLQHGSVILIGSDCGEITAELLNEGFNSLEYSEVVIGPSTDGGYYLIGTNDPVYGIFENITWSTGTVFKETMKRLLDMHLNIKLLPKLSDVDTLDDWKYLKEKSVHFQGLF